MQTALVPYTPSPLAEQESITSGVANFGEGALLGLAAALDGYLQGKVAAAQARDAREARLAQENISHRGLDLQRRMGDLEHLFKTKELGERGRPVSYTHLTLPTTPYV